MALDSGEVQNAYWDMNKQKADAKSRVWLNGGTSAFGYNGKTQFYICNNASEKSYFTVDQPQLDLVLNYQNACGGNGFWVMNDDKWSYGIDQSGADDCGGFQTWNGMGCDGISGFGVHFLDRYL